MSITMTRSDAPMASAEAGAAVWWATAAATFVLLLIPLLVTEIPPLLDYPNHLVRMGLISSGFTDPIIARMYTVQWGLEPNIGLDVVVPLLTRVMPLEVGGKIFLFLALALPVAGAAALHRSLFGRRALWPFASALVSYNGMFFAGFVNFLVGGGAALLGAALWERQRDRGTRQLACAAMIAIAAFFCHIIAVAFFGLLLFALEFGRSGSLRARLMRLPRLIVPFAIPAALFLSAPLRGEVPNAGHGPLMMLKGYYWALMGSSMATKLRGLESPFITYDLRLDTATVLLLLAALLVWALRGKLAWAPQAALAALLVLLIYPFVPFVFMDAAWVDQRLPVLAVVLVFAATAPKLLQRREAVLWFAAFAVLLTVRVGAVAAVWSEHDADLAALRQVMAEVPAGAKVLVVRPELSTDPHRFDNEPASRHFMIDNDSLTHLPSLLVLERHAFMPLLFSDPIKQPLRVRPPYDRIAKVDGAPPYVHALSAPTPTDIERALYLKHWREDFDYVLLIRPGSVPDAAHLLPDALEPMASNAIVGLYRIRKS